MFKPRMLSILMLSVFALCSCASSAPQNIERQKGPVIASRTSQQWTVMYSDSDFVFTTAANSIQKFGFTIVRRDDAARTLVADKMHNGNRIVFDLSVLRRGTKSLITMRTSYYDAIPQHYNEPYESFAAMMWDYLGVQLHQVK